MGQAPYGQSGQMGSVTALSSLWVCRQRPSPFSAAALEDLPPVRVCRNRHALHPRSHDQCEPVNFTPYDDFVNGLLKEISKLSRPAPC
jgi:hypothetical protein